MNSGTLGVLVVIVSGVALAQSSSKVAGLLSAPHPNSSQWHRALGQAYYEAGDLPSTLKHLQSAVRLDPSNEQDYLDLGEVLATNNAREAVVTVFEAARTNLPDSVRIQTALAVAYLTLRNYNLAVETLNHLIAKHDKDEIAYQLLAETYDIMQDWESAARTAEILRRLTPRNEHGWYYGSAADCNVSKRTGAPLSEAEAKVRRTLVLAPNDWRAHLLLGRILSDARSDAQAVSALRSAIALNAGEPKIYYILGQALRRQGLAKQSAEAFQAYERARAQHTANQRTLLIKVD